MADLAERIARALHESCSRQDIDGYLAAKIDCTVLAQVAIAAFADPEARRIACTSLFLPGSQPPEGYLNWHAWAKEQHRAGLKQKRCPKCRLWRYPQELSGEDIKGKLVCNECHVTGLAQLPDPPPSCQDSGKD